MKKFSLTTTSIDTQRLREELRDDSCGAYASFEGWVRNHHQDRSVEYLEYEALEELCVSEAETIFNEAREQFDITNVRCVHRIGKLNISDMAVWVGVTASHRDAAFKACRYIIDEIKSRLPIWKKEFYREGDSIWVNCAQNTEQTTAHSKEDEFYSRQTILTDIGLSGQKKLKDARVLVVGAGGLGSSALMALAGAGVGHIGICEYDKLDISNLHRQHLYTVSDVGKPKIDLAASRLQALNPYIKIIKHPERLDAGNVENLINDYEIICDCTDNFVTKFLLNDSCVLNQKPLVQASIYQHEGQIRTFLPEASGCLRCLWPEIPKPGCVGTCTEAGVIGTLPGTFGYLQAHEIIKLILNKKSALTQHTLLMNLDTFETQKLQQTRETRCPLCSDHPKITKIIPDHYHRLSNISINIESIAKTELDTFTFIDLRESFERTFAPVNQLTHVHWPFSKRKNQSFSFEPDKKYLLFCAKGIRSLAATEELHQEGITNTYSLENGVDAIQQYFKS
ncbi:MAG: ThiF family adenylyltransferase [Candidatus Omnitrophica bacterium]|nr:ThiF family adenylyltransferase [Candidatus Omnitrophota bacterium]